MSSDLDSLLEMGFDKERAELAIKKSGGLQGALEWLEQNQDKPMEEILEDEKTVNVTAGSEADGAGVANSLVCKECGKQFRDQAQAEFHASKSGHVDFEESTDSIKPLTEEEKKEKLEALRARLKEKRSVQSEEDKAQAKRNEQIRMKSTKDSQDIKEELKKKEQIKEAEARRREKIEDAKAKEAIRAKIQADKEARRQKAAEEKAAREGRPPPVLQAAPIAVTSPASTSSKPASEYTQTRLRLQTPSGSIQKAFPVETTLFEVAAALNTETGMEVTAFVQNYPKKTFDGADFGSTLKELGLVPSCALIVR